MKRTIILIVFLIISIIVISGLYFSRLSQSQNNIKRYIATIPANASLLLSFNNDSTFYNLFKDYEGFEMILGKEELNDLKILKETFLERADFLAITQQQPVYISFHAEEEQVPWLISLPLLEEKSSQFFQENLDSTISVQTIENAEGDYYELSIPTISEKVYVSVHSEKAMLSFSKSLIEKSLDKQSDHLSELFLEKFQENNRRNNSPLQLYINHDRLDELLPIFTRKKTSILSLFESLNGLSMLDLNYKSDALMFSGTSSITASDSSYLSLFISQEPITHQLKNWLPTHVAEVTTYGISDYSVFHAELENILEKRKELDQLREQIRYIEDKSDVVIKDELLSIWGNEFAKLTLNSGEEVGLIAIRDSLEYSLIADKISTLSIDTTMRQFDNSNLLYYSLGDPFKNLKRPYFTYANGYLVVANRQITLNDYLDRIRNQDLLIANEEFILFDKLQSTSSNFSLFIHRENADRLLQRNLKNQFKRNYNNVDNFGYKKFYGFSMQLSGNKDGFIVNMHGKFQQQAQVENR